MKKYELLPKLVLRTPMYPLSFILRQDGLNHDDVINLFDDVLVREAIFLASPSLYNECQKGFDNDGKEKLRLSVLKYLIRMSSRCTPFGLFAGFNMGQWGKGSNVVIDRPERSMRHTRLDMLYLCALGQTLVRDKDVRPYLLFYTNNAMYRLNSGIRYIECGQRGLTRKFRISRIDENDYLTRILATAKTGVYLPDLINELVSYNISTEEATEFVDQLVENQVLVSELEPNLTGPPYERVIVSKLEEIHTRSGSVAIESTLRILRDIKKRLKMLDARLGNNSEDYQRIIKQLEKLQLPMNQRMLFQVDLKKSTSSAVLDNKLAGQIRRAIPVLNAVSRRNLPSLESFANAFLQRYEMQEIPLLLALDNESGIGYGTSRLHSDINPAVDDIITPNRGSNNTSLKDPLSLMMLRKFNEALKNNHHEIVLTDEDINPFRREINLCNTFNALGSLVKDYDGTDAVLLKFVGSSSAANLLGRFTPFDDELDDYVRSIAESESRLNSDELVAEVVHLPGDRVGNVLTRTHIRDYEIPIGCNSTLPPEKQIPLDDLWVSVSPAGRISLRSASKNRIVIPRLSTAHNFSNNSQPAYHFLCDLQFQNREKGLVLEGEELLLGYPFLPRIRYENVILRRAKWQFESSDVIEIINDNSSEHSKLQSWRRHWMIPRYVSILESDHELLVDLENPLFLQLMEEELKKSVSVTFCEFLMPSNHVRDQMGEIYCNEFNIGFRRSTVAGQIKMAVTEVPATREQIKRNFVVGDEWLYYKVYAGSDTVEHLLVSVLPPLIETMVTRGLITAWFFTRYNDPEYHLRLRFKVPSQDKVGVIIQLICEHLGGLLDNHSIHNLALDTYKRELERYGPSAIEIVEDLFSIQSAEFLTFARSSDEVATSDSLRLLFGIYAINMTLERFCIEGERKSLFIKTCKDNFAREFNANGETFRSLSRKYKKHRAQLDMLMNKEWKRDLDIFQKLFKKYHDSYQKLCDMVVEKERSELLSVNLFDLVASVIHMHINKISRSKPRKFEFICYELLHLTLKNASTMRRTKAITMSSEF